MLESRVDLVMLQFVNSDHHQPVTEVTVGAEFPGGLASDRRVIGQIHCIGHQRCRHIGSCRRVGDHCHRVGDSQRMASAPLPAGGNAPGS